MDNWNFNLFDAERYSEQNIVTLWYAFRLLRFFYKIKFVLIFESKSNQFRQLPKMCLSSYAAVIIKSMCEVHCSKYYWGIDESDVEVRI